jgi:hypothetical protein
MNQSNLEKLKESDKIDAMEDHYDSDCIYKGEQTDPVTADTSINGYLRNHLLVVVIGSVVAGVMIYKMHKEQRSLSYSFISSTW